jgi:hypothetical protein
MATPKSARRTMSAASDGAAADSSSSIEKQTMFTMSAGRRPKRSAATPKRSAPSGRMASVSDTATVTAFTSVRKSSAMARMQKISRKKSTPKPQVSRRRRCRPSR